MTVDPIAPPSPAVERWLKASPISVASLLLGLFGWIQTTFVALLYLEESFLLVAAVVLVFSQQARKVLAEPVFRRLFIAFLITMTGYIASDLFRGSLPENYLRGWGRLILTMTSFLGITLLAAREPQSIWWFALGRGIGGVLSLKFVEHLHLFGSWKYAVDQSADFSSFGFAEYVGSALAALVWFLPLRWAALAFFVLGAFSFHLDFRYHAGICMLIACLLFFRTGGRSGGTAARLPVVRLALIATLAISALVAGYKLSEDPGAVGRRASSDVSRLFGLKVGFQALFESPLIGYGSWGRSKEIAAIEESVKAEMGPAVAARPITGLAAIVHSELFQSWLEGGVLGAAFFLMFLISLLGAFPRLGLARPMDPLLPVLLYWYLFASWEVVNAPFGANSRMHIALGAAALVISAMESRATSRREVPRPSAVPDRVDRRRERPRGRAGLTTDRR